MISLNNFTGKIYTHQDDQNSSIVLITNN